MKKIEKQFNVVYNGDYARTSLNVEKTFDVIIEVVNSLQEEKTPLLGNPKLGCGEPINCGTDNNSLGVTQEIDVNGLLYEYGRNCVITHTRDHVAGTECERCSSAYNRNQEIINIINQAINKNK